MSRPTCLAVLLASLLSAVSGALLAQPQAQAVDDPVVLSGPDIGFRVERYDAASQSGPSSCGSTAGGSSHAR